MLILCIKKSKKKIHFLFFLIKGKSTFADYSQTEAENFI